MLESATQPATASMSGPAPDGDEAATDSGRAPTVAHPFESPAHQFDAGKLGIWLFLISEVLFFGGLITSYFVYREAQPEIFLYGHYFLDRSLGVFNTCVLIISSFTAAWAVRCAQRGSRRTLLATITVTVLCGVLFLVVKGSEYSEKVHEGLLPGAAFNPQHQVWKVAAFRSAHPQAAAYAERLREHASEPTRGTARMPTTEQVGPLLAAGIIGPRSEYGRFPSLPHNAHQFFAFYFLLTGLHGLHVLIGIGIWIWLLVRAASGAFGPSYFGPIDYAALYWHFVDLVWLYLFPLFYLIH